MFTCYCVIVTVCYIDERGKLSYSVNKINAERRQANPWLAKDQVQAIKDFSDLTLRCQKGSKFDGFVQVIAMSYFYLELCQFFLELFFATTQDSLFCRGANNYICGCFDEQEKLFYGIY